MHGGATAIFAVISKVMSDSRSSTRAHVFLPGLALAAGLHTVYNHFPLSPLSMTLVVVSTLPIVAVVVFLRSERVVRKWLGIGFDTEAELLSMIVNGNVEKTRLGEYLSLLQQRFSAEVVVDMLCYLRVYLELALQAKGILLMREAGFDVRPGADAGAKLTELRFLERSIGVTGKIALAPLKRVTDRDLWQLRMLAEA